MTENTSQLYWTIAIIAVAAVILGVLLIAVPWLGQAIMSWMKDLLQGAANKVQQALGNSGSFTLNGSKNNFNSVFSGANGLAMITNLFH